MGTDTSKLTQYDMIIRYLKDHGSITQLDAIREFGCMRLAARIAVLKKRGLKIRRELEESRNRYGDIIRYARYFLDDGV